MLQPKKPLDLSEANQILQSERKPLDLSSAEAILKKKDSTAPNQKLDSETSTGSSDGVGSNGFPAIDVNLGIPGLKPELKTVEQLANPPKSKATLQQKETKKDEVEGFGEGLLNRLDTGIATISKSFYDAPKMILDAIYAPQNYLSEKLNIPSLKVDPETYAFENIPSKNMDEIIKNNNKKIENYKKEIGGDVVSAFDKGDYANTFKHAALNSMESVPLIVATMATGGESLLANSLMIGSSASTQYDQLNKEHPEMGTGTKLANAAVNGALEVAVGKFMEGVGGNVWKNVLTKKGVKETAQIATNSFKKTLEKVVGDSPMVGVVGEYAEERITDGLQQLNDIATGASSDFNWDQNRNAGLSSLGFGLPNATALYSAKAYISNQTKKRVTETSKQIVRLQNDLQNPDLSPEKKKIISENISKIYDENKKILGDELQKLDIMPEKTKKELVGIDKNIDKIKDSAIDIKYDVNISPESKALLLKNLEQDFKDNINRKNEILSKTSEVEFLPLKEQDKLKRQALKELTAEQNPDGTKNIEIDNAQIVERANKIYIKENEKPQEVAVTETKPQTEVPQQAEAEKVATPPVEDVVAPSVEKPLSSQEENVSMDNNLRKEKQLEIINKSNPAPNSHNTWIRTTDDIKEAKDVFETAFNEGEMYPDFTVDDMKEALDSGEIIIHSSRPIKNGSFVTPSRMNAEEYAGGQGSKIYSKTIKINDVAWIDESEGQYAPVKETKNAKTPPTNTPTDGNLRVEPTNVGESGNSEPKSNSKSSVPSSVDGGEVKGDVAGEKKSVTLPNIDDIANFINETYLNDGKKEIEPTAESDKGAKENSVDENSEKPASEEKAKKISLKGRTPLSKRKFRGDRAKASNVEVADEHSLVLNHFVRGGKISSDYVQESLSEGDKKAKNNGFNGIASKSGKGIDALAHELWDENHNLDIAKIKKSIEDVVRSHDTVQDITETILKNNDVSPEKTPEEYANDYANHYEVKEEQKASDEEMQEAESSLDQLSEAEIIELANNQEKEFEDYIKDLESRQVTYDLGPISEQGTIQPDGWILSENGELLSPQSVRNVKQVNPYIEVGILSEFGNIGKEGVVTLLKAIKAQLSMESGGVGKPFGVNIWTNEQGEIKYVGNNAKRSKGLIQNTFAFDLNDNLLKEKSIINSKEALKAVEDLLGKAPTQYTEAATPKKESGGVSGSALKDVETKTNTVNGYEFSKTPTLESVIVEPIDKSNNVTIEKQMFVDENKNVLAKGVKYVGGGWYEIGGDNFGSVDLYNTVTKEGVSLNHKQGGRMGVVVQDFIKNNSRYNDNIAVRGSKFTEAEHNPNFGGSGHYKGTYFYVGLNAESKALEHGKNLSKVDIENANLYELGGNGQTSQSLKNEAKKAGYDTRDASGYAESEYLKKQGYDGIKRGNEIVLFEPKKFESKAPTQYTEAATPKKESGGVSGSALKDVESRKKEMKSENDKLIKRKRELANDRDDVVTGEGKYKNFSKKERDARLEEIRNEVNDIDAKQVSLQKELKVIEAKETGSVELFDHYSTGHGSTNTIIYDIKNDKLVERENVVRGKTKDISIEDAAKQKFAKSLRGRNQREINEAYTEKEKAKYEGEIKDEIDKYKQAPTQYTEAATPKDDSAIQSGGEQKLPDQKEVPIEQKQEVSDDKLSRLPKNQPKSTWQQEQDAIDSDAALTNEQKQEKKVEVTAKALEGADTFHLVENEGEWKATTKTYRGREIGNWAISNLDKKQQKEYLKIRDEADTYGTKEQAEENLKKLKDFEQKNKEAFERAKQEIDALKEAEERKAEERKKQQKIFDQTEQELNKLSDKEFDKLVELIDEKRRQTLEQRFGDRVEKRTLFITPISEAYHKAKADGTNPELVKAVEEVISNIPEKLEVKTPISKDTPELKEVNAKLEKANENLRIAKEALDRKAKSLDKELLKDNEDLFGERKSQSENKLFDERVDSDARNKATEKERKAITDAQNEIKSLKETKAKIESGEIISTSEMDFDNNESEYKFTDTPTLKDAKAIDGAELPITNKATENIIKNEGSWNKALKGDVKNLGNGWFEVGKTTKGESILYAPETDKAVTIIDSKNKGGRNSIYVRDFVENNPQLSKKEQLKKQVDVEVDKYAQKIKDLLPGIKDPDLKKQGISQDDLIDLVASAVKALVSKGIDINDAIRQVIASIKERFNVDVDEKLVKEKLGVEKEILSDELSDFRDLIRDIPQKDEVKNYLSGETIERVHGNIRNDQSYNVVSLADLALHGKLVMDRAKELFGDQYVEKTLDFLESANLEADEKAIQYVALENEMDNRVSENPTNLGERKLQDLVREKSQAHLRKSAIAINAGRLRAIMKYGIDVNKYPDEILTSKQKQAKNEIEKLVQHTSEDINKEDELQEEGDGFVIAEPKAKRDKAIVKSEISDVIKKLRADLIKSARGQSLNVSIPYAEQIKVATPHIIKLSKLFAELGGMKTKEIIDAIHDELSKVFPAIKKSDVSSVLKEVYEEKSKPKDKKIQEIVKQALIDAGFSRKVKIKGEEKTLLDWKKLAGEESSIPKLKANVEKSLKAQGYTNSQIEKISKSLEEEYIRLGADIIQKGLRELENRDKLTPSPTRKTDAKRLSELYNYGLFNGEKATEYDNLLNKTLGLSEFDVETYQKIKSLAKALASVYNQENNGRKISEIAVQTLNSTINHQIKSLLATSALKNGTKAFNVASAFDDYVGLSMRALLGSVSTLTENKISGEFQVQLQKAFSSGEITPELKKQIEADKKAVFRDITRNAGLFYGDTNTSLTHSSRFEEWLNGKADKAMAHTVVSSFLLRAFLDGVDSSVKVRLTQKAFVKNVIKLLTSETNPNGKMNTEEAIKYVSEQLTGENFEKALKTAKSIIENVNEEQGEKVIKDTDEAIHRFAMDLVKENLLSSNMLTMDNIESAYKSAYKSAGRSIGHEANNIISAGVNLLNSTLNKRLEKAIQEKKYPLATSLTLLSTIQKSILNPFVGGGTNWVILGLEKSGNPLGYISVIHNATERRKLDLSENKSDITQSLYRESIYKDSAVRLLAGTAMAMAMFAALTIGDDDEELLGKLNQWLKDNPWAKKHFNKLAPEVVTFLLDMKNGELSKHWQRVLGMKNDYFDNIKTLINTFSDENSSMSGAFGAFLGQNLNSPGPWKTIKDVRDILRGLKGLPEIKTDYKTNGFWNGYFRAGLVDFAKLRPGVNYDLNSKIDKVKDDEKKLNSEIDSFVKYIYDEKLSDAEINKKIDEKFSAQPLKKERIKESIKNRAEEEKLKRSGVDPFYIKLKRESNDEIKAILFQDRFKDLSKTTPAEQKEIEKGMNAIGFKGSQEFWNTYWRLAHPENYKNKPIN